VLWDPEVLVAIGVFSIYVQSKYFPKIRGWKTYYAFVLSCFRGSVRYEGLG